MWQTIVFIIVFSGSPPTGTVYPPIGDLKGPYTTIEECYFRGSEMIKDLLKEVPIIEAKVRCQPLDEKIKENSKGATI